MQSAATGEKLALTPGMLVAAEIHQGRRTVLEYLLSPVRKVAARGTGEGEPLVYHNRLYHRLAE